MRLSLPILLAIAVASPAAAHPDLDIHAENRLAAREALARQRELAADREALVMESRLRTADALSGLDRRRPAFELSTEALFDPTLAAEIEAVANLQAKALAESNARLRGLMERSGER